MRIELKKHDIWKNRSMIPRTNDTTVDNDDEMGKGRATAARRGSRQPVERDGQADAELIGRHEE